MKLSFPYRDSDLFIVEKPAAMHSTGDGHSLENLLRSQIAEVEQLPDAGLVQRLDYETTGILAGGLTEKTQTDLRYLLSLGKFTKSYLVVVEGRCERGAVVEGYLYSRYRGSAKVSMQANEKGRAQFSRSVVLPLRSFNNVTVVKVECSIARRHQVRVHMSSIGHPLVGDTLYGSRLKLFDIGFEDYPSSFILIAAALEFLHPVSEEKISCRAQISAESLIERLQSRSSTV